MPSWVTSNNDHFGVGMGYSNCSQIPTTWLFRCIRWRKKMRRCTISGYLCPLVCIMYNYTCCSCLCISTSGLLRCLGVTMETVLVLLYRTHTFAIRTVPDDMLENCSLIYNLNVRGKRGNIVQVYPGVEYDFVPNRLEMAVDDCIHIQCVKEIWETKQGHP